MAQGDDLILLHTLLVGIGGMFLMAIAIILFFLVYQKRLLRQQKLQIKMESEHQKDLLHASLKSQEAERQRIARDLHDDVGTLLSTSRLYLEQLMEQPLEKDQLKLSEKMMNLHMEIIHTIRNIAKDLRPVVLESLGIRVAIASLANRINTGKAIHVAFTSDTEHIPLAKNQELELYRILQELITNTLKHAAARQISIDLSVVHNVVCMRYEDDGIGFDPATIPLTTDGLGLKNIESRINILNGKIEYGDVPVGTQLLISIPIHANAM